MVGSWHSLAHQQARCGCWKLPRELLGVIEDLTSGTPPNCDRARLLAGASVTGNAVEWVATSIGSGMRWGSRWDLLVKVSSSPAGCGGRVSDGRSNHGGVLQPLSPPRELGRLPHYVHT